MMPLCTTTRSPLQSRWGWAFCSEGRPWVAHRVWPIPVGPGRGEAASAFSSAAIFPTLRQSPSFPPAATATPAESYPRYSSRRSPSSRISAASRRPTYPTMPHMLTAPFLPRTALPLRPSVLVLLGGARDREGVRRDVAGDGRARRDDGPAPHRDRRHQHGAAADEDPV